MNKVILMGRLTRDAEVRYSQGENSTAIARFSLAVDRRFRRDGDEQTADFINCVAFGKTAEFIEKYINKGRQICVSGRIQTGSYTNRDGQKIYTTEVVVEEVDFADSRRSDDTADTPADAAGAMPAPQAAAAPADTGMDGFAVDEDIPFN